jgi:hypothetical protein
MDRNYDGLPAAGSMEQAIILAQLLILRDLDRRARHVSRSTDPVAREQRSAA